MIMADIHLMLPDSEQMCHPPPNVTESFRLV